ncbi:SpoU rRNA Methylase family protein [Marivirga sericea]|uniref:SpoU rRNA Methylase family protein n=1 Tax=Marivirga sericea TaxID=1028 RepID=A0A1X7LAX5_9BACT|nr:TrmH family RNA methyltransferase [Marivirga sericea]SMG50697.1 SpoU rRNA Methylase family protein [Marivirga sericea]
MIQKEHDHIENEKHDFKIALIAENIRTPENVGMMMRLSEAFGVEEIYFVGDQAIDLTTKVKRASRNTYKTVNYQFGSPRLETLKHLIESGYHSIALEITDSSKPLQKYSRMGIKKIALVVGSERQGVSEELLKLCQYHYHIPMYGENSSINVVNALSIALYKITENIL